MNKHDGMKSLPAPCIVDEGILVNQDDIKRSLADLYSVYYIHTIGDRVSNEGQGLIQEIFSDRHQSTLIANQNIYINIQSFDYLQLSKSTNNQACYDLIQDNRQLRLIPTVSPSQTQVVSRNIDVKTIEAMVAEVLSARLDVQLDDEDFQ